MANHNVITFGGTVTVTNAGYVTFNPSSVLYDELTRWLATNPPYQQVTNAVMFNPAMTQAHLDGYSTSGYRVEDSFRAIRGAAVINLPHAFKSGAQRRGAWFLVIFCHIPLTEKVLIELTTASSDWLGLMYYAIEWWRTILPRNHFVCTRNPVVYGLLAPHFRTYGYMSRTADFYMAKRAGVLPDISPELQDWLITLAVNRGNQFRRR